MNKIVVPNYPVERPPADLKQGLDSDTGLVRVEIEIEDTEEPAQQTLSAAEALALMRDMQRENRGRGVTEVESVERIRSLRDNGDE